MVLVLFPLAVPVIALTVLLASPLVLAAGLLAAPVVLVRRLARRRRGEPR